AESYVKAIEVHYTDWAQWSIIPTGLVQGGGSKRENLNIGETSLLDRYGIITVGSGEYVYLSSLVTGRSVEMYLKDFEMLMAQEEAAIQPLSEAYPLLPSLFLMEAEEADDQ
ncbi:MAG: hypothetical protein OIF58_16005, partial [Cohaesibacter sp.]|nr:hypothetical protein [Cohaesibacter sp.]